ncbi:MAG: radical SAM protein, partial [Candidatus Omnitrophica bacterium]|nr:radical SAM protein [Candidatus Omnitrophota bacterium]
MKIWEQMFKGIGDERRAFCGPYTVQIDLTDKCNSSCIACWVHSPLVDEKKIFPGGKKDLPFNLVEKLIHELHSLGTTEIILSGSGEPFIYPCIQEVIKLIKEKGMYLNIITNATFINRETVKLLVEYKVDLITASIWAGTAQAYVSTHPGKEEKDF